MSNNEEEVGDYIGPILGRAFFEAARKVRDRAPDAGDEDVIRFVFFEMLVGLLSNLEQRVGRAGAADLLERVQLEVAGDSNAPRIWIQLKPRRGTHE